MSSSDMFEKTQQLFIIKYQHHNSAPIPRRKFLESGWTAGMFLRYYTVCTELYYVHSTHPLDYCSSHISLLHVSKGNDNTDNALLSYRAEQYSALMEKYIGFKPDVNRILDICCTVSIQFPYLLFTGEEPTADEIPFFISFENYIGWIECLIGEQLSEKDKSVASQPTRRFPITVNTYSELYKLSYSELKDLGEKTDNEASDARNALLNFDDYYAPNGRDTLSALYQRYSDLVDKSERIDDRIAEFDAGDFSYIYDTLYIFKGENKCFREHHNIEAVTGDVIARHDKYVNININYCNDCHKYFISEQEFFHYRDLFGIVCKLEVDRTSTGYARFPMAEYSILRLYGYNVSKEDNYSDAERQQLLRVLIENDYVSKPEIIKYLNMFIKMNGSKDNMEDSVFKWESDLEFVRNLGIESQPKVHINEIKYAH